MAKEEVEDPAGEDGDITIRFQIAKSARYFEIEEMENRAA